MLSHLLLLVSLATTIFMTGLIWFVQVVHYAMFANVGLDPFTAYHPQAYDPHNLGGCAVMLLEGESGEIWPLFAARAVGIAHVGRSSVCFSCRLGFDFPRAGSSPEQLRKERL